MELFIESKGTTWNHYETACDHTKTYIRPYGTDFGPVQSHTASFGLMRRAHWPYKLIYVSQYESIGSHTVIETIPYRLHGLTVLIHSFMRSRLLPCGHINGLIRLHALVNNITLFNTCPYCSIRSHVVL